MRCVTRFGCVDSPFYGNLRNCGNKLSAAEKMCFWWRVASKRFTRLSLVVMSKRHLLHCMPFYKTEINVTCHFHWKTFKLGERGVKLLYCINIFNIFHRVYLTFEQCILHSRISCFLPLPLVPSLFVSLFVSNWYVQQTFVIDVFHGLERYNDV